MLIHFVMLISEEEDLCGDVSDSSKESQGLRETALGVDMIPFDTLRRIYSEVAVSPSIEA